MRTVVVSGLLIVACSVSAGAQQRPDMSGGWSAVKDAPEGIAAAPSPVFGARFWLRHQGQELSVIRPMRDTAMVATHVLDGPEAQSRVAGGLCLGDSAVTTSAGWEGNNIVYRIVGTIPPGGWPPVKSGLKYVFKLQAPDTLVVEGTMRTSAQAEPSAVATVYKRTTDAAPAPPAAPAVKTAPATLANVSWIAGTWIGTSGPTTFEERWTPASGGTMLATSRTLRNTAVSEFEFLCIAERHGSLVYTAMPNGRSPATDFMLTSVDETSATFENPAHDFPKMIRYAKRPDGSLEATISGQPNQRGITFVFKRQEH